MTAVNWGERHGAAFGIADVVARTDVPASSIHHYINLGLVPQPERCAPNRFLYDDRHVVALSIIRALRRRGRTLDDIRAAMPALWQSGNRVQEALDDYMQEQPRHTPVARLVDAAIEAFSQQSFGEVSIDALCAGAGIAKGTFYRHFPNKEVLFVAATRAVVERAVSGFTAEMEIESAADVDAAARFAKHLRPALPMLFELGKRSVGDAGPVVADATALFMDLVERLGKVVRSTELQDAAQAGGVLVIMSLVEIFTRLLAGDDPSASRHPSALGRLDAASCTRPRRW